MRKTILLFCIVAFFSCEKDIQVNNNYESHQWPELDLKGGDWKTILGFDKNSIVIPPAASITDAAYINELNALKTKANAITEAQKEIALNWTNNPVLRWNEIARDLATKYNLAPAANADGTYPVPNAATPDVYPYFPFAHPPYASRMFAYLSVASYDALITSWYYSNQIKRPAISASAKDISAFLSDGGIPSYPSHGAAVTASAKSILSAMFPLEKDYLTAMANQHYESLIYSGLNVQSDIDAGIKIGTEVAAIALKRSASDGMKSAQAAKPVADSIKALAQSKFGWSFQNLEIPERKVGLVANFGKVKTWSNANLESIRPPLPPALDSDAFKKASKELEDIAANRTSDQRKIAIFWADGTNTYTPPGHWNRIACEYINKYKLNPLRSARTLAYTNMAIMDGGIACWDAKYYYHYPRPNQVISGFKTLLGTPNFPGYTSGHSTFSAAAAEMLSYVFPQDKATFDKYAHEASESRIFGGIHFRFDCEAGLESGKKVAQFILEIAKKDGAN